MVNDVRHELYPEFLQRTCPYFFTFDRVRRCYKWANIAFIQVSHTTQYMRFLEPKGTTESGVQKGVNPLQQAVRLPQSPWNIFEVKTISTNAACSDYRRSSSLPHRHPSGLKIERTGMTPILWETKRRRSSTSSTPEGTGLGGLFLVARGLFGGYR